jgi:hypothetical protein
MALAGSLKEFGLADILQLIFYQRKTGNLTLNSRFDTVRVLFSEGNIVLAESSKRRVEGRLGRVLVRKGVISNEKLKAVIEEHKRTRKKVGHMLVEKNLATREEIQHVLSDQITELIVQLFSWKEGRYEFTPGAVPIDKEIPISVDTQGLMMDSLRIFDEWSIFKGRIDQGTVFVRTTKPDEGLSQEPIVAELFSYVDGQNDVHKIAALLGQNAFQTAKDLLQLVDLGLIEERSAAAAEEELLQELEPATIPGLSILIAVVAIAALALSAAAFMFRTDVDLGPFLAAQEIDTLRYKIEIQKESEGSYPRSVAGTDPWGNPYVYEPSARGFAIYSAGPDAVAGTEDDVH